MQGNIVIRYNVLRFVGGGSLLMTVGEKTHLICFAESFVNHATAGNHILLTENSGSVKVVWDLL